MCVIGIVLDLTSACGVPHGIDRGVFFGFELRFYFSVLLE